VFSRTTPQDLEIWLQIWKEAFGEGITSEEAILAELELEEIMPEYLERVPKPEKIRIEQFRIEKELIPQVM